MSVLIRKEGLSLLPEFDEKLKELKSNFKNTTNTLAHNWTSEKKAHYTESGKIEGFAYQVMSMTNDLFVDIRKEIRKAERKSEQVKGKMLIDENLLISLIKFAQNDNEIESDEDIAHQAAQRSIGHLLTTYVGEDDLIKIIKKMKTT